MVKLRGGECEIIFPERGGTQFFFKGMRGEREFFFNCQRGKKGGRKKIKKILRKKSEKKRSVKLMKHMDNVLKHIDKLHRNHVFFIFHQHVNLIILYIPQ